MSEPKLLDEQLLAALEQRWRAKGASTPEIMEPGLTDVQIDEAAAPLGFPLPDELRTLYRWHNGSGLHEMVWARGMWALDPAVSTSVGHRSDDEYWRPGWILLSNERPYALADCLTNGRYGPVPVWNYDVQWGPPSRPVFASVGDMVSLWIELIDDDLMYWDGRLWQLHDDRVPDETMERLSGIPEA